MDNTTTSSSDAMAVTTETVVGSHVLTTDWCYTKMTSRSGLFRVGGHGWYIECYPYCGQDEEGADWVSVFLCLDHHGAANHEEVKATYRFVLLDGAGEEVLSARSRRVQTFSSNDGSWGIAKFIQRKPLESYLIIQDDDCCRIRCDVTVIKEPPAVAPSQDLHRSHLGDLLLASEVGRDVTFVIGGEQFTAHSCVLAARSSTAFMAEVLVGTWKESAGGGGGSRHVRVDGVAPRVFKALLRFMYTETLPDELADHGETIAIARGLLVVADRYGMERLKLICSDMLCGCIDATTAVDTLQLAHKHGCLKLNQACVKFISGMLDAFNLEETK